MPSGSVVGCDGERELQHPKPAAEEKLALFPLQHIRGSAVPAPVWNLKHLCTTHSII